MSTEIARPRKEPIPAIRGQIIVRDTGELFRVAEHLYHSSFVPKSFKSVNDVAAAIMLAGELGKSPMWAMSSIAVINGKPGLYGDALLSLVHESGKMAEFREEWSGEGGADNYAITVTASRSDTKVEMSSTFSIADAKRAGLWGKAGPWQNYPKRMMQFRARGFLLRDLFADVLGGVKPAEELEDYPRSREPNADVDLLDVGEVIAGEVEEPKQGDLLDVGEVIEGESE